MSSFCQPSRLDIRSFPPIKIDPSLEFQHPVTKMGYQHWHEKRGDREMPDRSDIDPRAFGQNIGHLSLFNLRFDGDQLLGLEPRLIGSDLEAVFGDLQSAPLEETLPEPIYTRWRNVVTGMMAEQGPVRATGPIAFEGKHHLNTELVVAPLSNGEAAYAVLYVVSVFAQIVKPVPATPDVGAA